MCSARGIVSIGAVVDHVRPHHGNWNKFRTAELQTLCTNCHESLKKRAELDGYAASNIGPDGWPTDPAHPANSLKTRFGRVNSSKTRHS
jgi:5-methylcytosine-specific restriction endonuclease McrA